jgi:hypothetical protein
MVWKEASESTTQLVGGGELGPGVASMVTGAWVETAARP